MTALIFLLLLTIWTDESQQNGLHKNDTSDLLVEMTRKMTEMQERMEAMETKQNACHKTCEENDQKQQLIRRARDVTLPPVAFSAFLDHTVTLGPDQTLVFNYVLLNEGKAYSGSSGIFRAPVAGLYLFSWAVSARKTGHEYDVWVTLMVNGSPKLGALAESRAEWDDNQGSNTEVVRLDVGDEVWIAHEHATTQPVFGDTGARSTSFSGVLLHA